MVSPENTSWLFDYGLMEDIAVPASGFSWPVQPLDGSSKWGMDILLLISCPLDGSSKSGDQEQIYAPVILFDCSYSICLLTSFSCGIWYVSSVEIDSFGESDSLKETGSKKRTRPESCGTSSSKACREKLRRDKLNDKFIELGSILEPGRPPKTDKSAILVDAVRMVTQLRGEAQKLKDSNSNLQEKIKELKAEKNELRDEKQRLKAEKDKLEQQLKTMPTQPGFLLHIRESQLHLLLKAAKISCQSWATQGLPCGSSCRLLPWIPHRIMCSPACSLVGALA
ncbi:hypothetical protein C3L33_09915, partial [Rhododendron williamsianum]